MFESIILLLIFSIDTLLVCISYTIKKIRIPNKSILVISSICSISLLISYILSNILKIIININIISSIILILLGLNNIFNEKIKKQLINNKNKLVSIYVDETKADLDNSKNLNYKEATMLSIILSLDSIMGGISIINNNNIIPIIFITFIINLSFITLGNIIGHNISKHSINISYISGIILILIGVFKII